jgi:hypothetical protein
MPVIKNNRYKGSENNGVIAKKKRTSPHPRILRVKFFIVL